MVRPREPTAPTSFALVPFAFAVVPFENVPIQIYIFLIEVPFTRGKLLFPFQREVQGLIVSLPHHYFHEEGPKLKGTLFV